MKRMLVLLAPILMLAGCGNEYSQPENDYLSMVASVMPAYSSTTFDSTLLSQGYAACHMLEAGMPENIVLQQVPEDDNIDAEGWYQQVSFARSFLCPGTLKTKEPIHAR
jgi:hypothetical protein